MIEEDFIDSSCPWCQGEVSFPQSDAGRLQECPLCYEPLIMPGASGQPAAKPPLPIVARRLKLRRFQPGDWQGLMECFPDLPEDRALAWLEHEHHVRLTTLNQIFYLAVELVEGGQLAGRVGLGLNAFRQQAELSYELNEKFADQGMAPEALDALLGFCFTGLGLHRVYASVVGAAPEACRVYEDLGMRREGEFVKDQQLNGEWVNTVWFAALAEEYKPDAPDDAPETKQP